MIQPTIRCANPQCEHTVSMGEAMRVGTRLYCSFHCANLVRSGEVEGEPSGAYPVPEGVRPDLRTKAG